MTIDSHDHDADLPNRSRVIRSSVAEGGVLITDRGCRRRADAPPALHPPATSCRNRSLHLQHIHSGSRAILTWMSRTRGKCSHEATLWISYLLTTRSSICDFFIDDLLIFDIVPKANVVWVIKDSNKVHADCIYKLNFLNMGLFSTMY